MLNKSKTHTFVHTNINNTVSSNIQTLMNRENKLKVGMLIRSSNRSRVKSNDSQSSATQCRII